MIFTIRWCCFSIILWNNLFLYIGVRLISDIYRQFFLFGFTQWFRSFCADRKNQRALRMGAFLTAAEADDFWGCGTRSLRSLKQSSPLSKSHWRRLPKSLMRINEPLNEILGLVLTWIFNLKQFKYVYRTAINKFLFSSLAFHYFVVPTKIGCGSE